MKTHWIWLGLLLAAGLARAEPVAVEARGELGDWLKLDGFGTLSAYRADDPVASVRPDARNAVASLRGWRLDGDS